MLEERLNEEMKQALKAGILSETEAAMLRDYDRRVLDLINVDDFSTEELAAASLPPAEVRSARVSSG